MREWQERNRALIDGNPKILRRAPEREKLRNTLNQSGITPPQNPPGIEIKIKQPEPKSAPNAPQIIIEGHFVDPAKKVKVQPADTADAERQKTIETIRTKAKIITAKAKELQQQAQIAQYKAAVADTRAKIATRNANTARGQINLIKAKAQIRDKNVSRQIMDAKQATADAKKLHSAAEIKKIEARAAKRRYTTLLRLENGGKLNVAVNTRAVQPIPVTVKPPPNVKKIAATAVKPVVKTREQLIDTIRKQAWYGKIKEEQIADVNKFLSSLDDKRLRFFEKYGNLIKGDFYLKNSGYHQGGNIFIDLAKCDERSEVLGYKKANIRVFLHETGHLMDKNLGIRNCLTELEEKLKYDFLNYADNLLGTQKRYNSALIKDKHNGVLKSLDQYYLFTAEEKRQIESNVQGPEKSNLRYIRNGVSDLIQGLTRYEINAGYGHNDGKYWYRRDNPLIAEAIAHLFEAYMNGGAKYDNFKKYFPSTMQYFEDYVNKLI